MLMASLRLGALRVLLAEYGQRPRQQSQQFWRVCMGLKESKTKATLEALPGEPLV